MDKWKTFTIKCAWHHNYQGFWLVQMGLIYSKSRVWCHSFLPVKEHYLCFVVFSLLFSIIVDPQQQLSHSIITQSNNKNNKQLSQSQVDPSVMKQFRCECLWCHAQALTQNQTLLSM